jgi:hypothetical protein
MPPLMLSANIAMIIRIEPCYYRIVSFWQTKRLFLRASSKSEPCHIYTGHHPSLGKVNGSNMKYMKGTNLIEPSLVPKYRILF